MRAGLLRTLVSIERIASHTKGELGGRTPVWETFAQAYASIEAVNGKETPFGKGFASTANYKIDTRFIDGVTTSMRVAVYSDDEYATLPLAVYAINSVADPDNRRRSLTMTAQLAENT